MRKNIDTVQAVDAGGKFIFISYSSKDKDIVDHDFAELERHHVPLWRDSERFLAGFDWKSALGRIKSRECVGVIFYISENSIISKPVRKELRAARKRFGKPVPIEKESKDTREGYFSVNIGGKAPKELKKQMKASGKKGRVSREFLRWFPKDVLYIARDPEVESCAHLEKLLDVLKYYDVMIPGVCDKFRYEIVDDGICITGYVGTASEIIVPEEILGKKVVAVANDAFKMNETIESIILPDTVKRIGEGAFRAMTKLRNLTLPNSLEFLGEAAFRDTPMLRELVLPNGLSELRQAMFRGCGIRELIIPDSVCSLGEAIFSGCSELETLYIPDYVESMTEGGFVGCGKLRNLVIPRDIKGLNERSFSDCPLVDVIIGDLHYHDGIAELL